MTPSWKLISAAPPVRCQHCGTFTGTVWLCFTKPAVWTLAYCEQCAETLTEEGNMKTRKAETLRAGDTFQRDGITVTVLRDSEPCSDRFGSKLFRFWCRRSDTNAEGWCTFGPGGVVQA